MKGFIHVISSNLIGREVLGQGYEMKCPCFLSDCRRVGKGSYKQMVLVLVLVLVLVFVFVLCWCCGALWCGARKQKHKPILSGVIQTGCNCPPGNAHNKFVLPVFFIKKTHKLVLR